jgi:lia operon protein LiaF
MDKRLQIYVGATIVALGVLSLVGTLWNIDVWGYLWPLLFIAAGVLLLTRARSPERYGETHVRLLGDVRRLGAWTVREQEIWCIIGDVNLDLTQAEVPAGETPIRVVGFVGDVTVTLPEDVGLAVSTTAMVTTARVFGQKQDYVFTPYRMESDAYREANRKIRLDLLYMVADLHVRRPRT